MLQRRFVFISILVGVLLTGCDREPDADAPLVRDPNAGDPIAGDPIAGDPIAGDPIAGDPIAGDPIAGDSLVGKWEDSRGKSWEYFTDGTVLMSEKGKDPNFIGNWSRLDGGRVKIEFLMLGNSVGEVFTEEANGDDILFTDSKGQESNWKRVQ